MQRPILGILSNYLILPFLLQTSITSGGGASGCFSGQSAKAGALVELLCEIKFLIVALISSKDTAISSNLVLILLNRIVHDCHRLQYDDFMTYRLFGDCYV